MAWLKVRTRCLGTADKFISTTDKQLQEQLKQLHVTLLNLKVVTTYAKELVEKLAAKTKPHHLQRQTSHAHTRIRNPQKLKASAGTKAVVVAASLCDALSQGHPVGCVNGGVATSARAMSVVFRLYLNDVGIGPRAVAVVRT